MATQKSVKEPVSESSQCDYRACSLNHCASVLTPSPMPHALPQPASLHHAEMSVQQERLE